MFVILLFLLIQTRGSTVTGTQFNFATNNNNNNNRDIYEPSYPFQRIADSQSPYNGLNLLFRDSFLPGDDFDF